MYARPDRPPIASLGFKLNLALLTFLLILAASTAGLLLYGFQRTSANAETTSRAGLEELGQSNMLVVAADQSSFGTLQLEWASDAGQAAARYMTEYKALGGPLSFDMSRLVRKENGITYDPDPSRRADVAMPNFVSLNSAVGEDIAFGTALDAFAPSVLSGYPGRVRGSSFDAIAFFFTSVNQATRYYPPVGIQEVADPATDYTGRLALVGPLQNPERRTVWTTPYADNAGQGLVITAYTPVYEGNVYRGLVGIDISMARLIEVVDSQKLTPGGFAFYIDKDGTLLRSASFGVLGPEIEAGNQPLLDTIEAMKSGRREVSRVSFNGEPYFVAYSSMEAIGGSFAVAAPVSEITRQAEAITASIDREGDRTLQLTLMAMIGIFLIGLMAAGWLNRKLILRPVDHLVNGTLSVASGDLDTTIPVHGDDEMTDLARSFNQMTAEIRQRRAALQEEVRSREAAQDELKALFASMTDIVLVIDKDGRFVRVPLTAAPARLMAHEELQGKTLKEVMPYEQAGMFLKPIREALAQKQTITIEYPLIVDDTVTWFSSAISPLSENEVVIVAREITDRVEAQHRLEQQVEERTRELTTILNISRNVASTLELAPLLELIIAQIKNIADYSRCSILLLEGDSLVIRDTRSTTAGLASPVLLRVPLENVKTLWAAAVRGEVSIVDDVRDDTVEAADYRRAAGDLLETAFRDVRSWMAVPLYSNQRITGVLTLSHTQRSYFNVNHARLVSAVATQVAVAIENARLYERAQQLAAVEERQRLARELHDSVSQALYGIALGARTARTLLDKDAAKAVEPVDYVLSLAEAGLAEMRALIFELRPESLETEGLVAALEKQIAATSARYGLRIEMELDGEPELPLPEKEVFYRIGQEALHNVVKHAKATEAKVRLVADNGIVALEVQDNGLGFDAKRSYPGHMGLVSMAERAESIQGRFEVSSTPGSGTRIRLTREKPAPDAIHP